MTTHALLSPSSSKRWLNCPPSVAMTVHYVPAGDDPGSEHALLGTLAHGAAYRILSQNSTRKEDCENAVYAEFLALRKKHDTVPAGLLGSSPDWQPAIVATEIQPYVDYVRGLHLGETGCLMLEERLDISHITQEAGAGGTGDCVAVLSDDTLVVADLKYGKGVQVYAEGNTQLLMYAAAALDSVGLLYDIQKVRMVIVQPRLNHIDEWEQSAEQITAFSASVKAPAEQALHFVRNIKDGALPDMPQEAFRPDVETCRWCQVKGYCNALQDHALATVLDDLPTADDTLPEHVQRAIDGLATPDIDIQRLAFARAALDLVRLWADAVEQRVETLLHQGETVPGFKLVMGREGNRKWESEQAVDDAFSSMRLPVADFYTKKPVSPTECAKLHKAGKVGDRQWTRLQKIIVRTPAKPCVVPESDKRPAISLTDDLPDDLSDANESPAVAESAHA